MAEKEPLRNMDYLKTSYQYLTDDQNGSKRGSSMLNNPQSSRRICVSLRNLFRDFVNIGSHFIRSSGMISGIISPVFLTQLTNNLILQRVFMFDMLTLFFLMRHHLQGFIFLEIWDENKISCSWECVVDIADYGIGYSDFGSKRIYCVQMDTKRTNTVGKVMNPQFPPAMGRTMLQRRKMCPGDLFVSLRYDALKQEIEAVVRKAHRLCHTRKSTNSIRSMENPDLDPDVFFVIINLRRGSSIVRHKLTTPMAGVSPEWNRVFLFPMMGESVESHSLEFLVVKGTVFTRDNVLGHVVVGSSTTAAGEHHWNEMLSPRSTLVTRWHQIVPLTY